MKLCKDCKHHEVTRKHKPVYDKCGFRIGGFDYDAHMCRRGQSYVMVELVNGNGHYKGEEKDCYVEREDALRLEEFRCGKEGKFWEAK